MDTEILKKLVEEQAIENASIQSFNSAASRLRAAAAAAQPTALAMLNSVRGAGLVDSFGGGGLGGSMGQSLFSPAPSSSTSSIYEMAIFKQRLVAMEEQSRMRVMVQAAAAMRQQQQQQMQGLAGFAQQQMRYQDKKRPATGSPPVVSMAMTRLLKKRKVADLPPLALKKQNGKKTSIGFILPKVKGKDHTPSIKPLSSFKRQWDNLVARANSKVNDEKERHEFIKFHFGKALRQNRALQDVEDVSSWSSDNSEDSVLENRPVKIEKI